MVAVQAKDAFKEDYEQAAAQLPRFSGGHQVTSQSAGLSAEKSRSGGHALRIDFAFESSGWAVYQAIETLPGKVYPGSLREGDRIRFYTLSEPNPATINLQVIDANGEFFQMNFPLSSYGWIRRQVRLRAAAFAHHWNGDGKLDFPLSQLNFTVNAEQPTAGTLYIDDFEISGSELTTEWPPEDFTVGGKYTQARVDAALALRNRPVLDRPVIAGKHMLAHNMASLFDENTPDLAFLVREFYNTQGSTAELGGYIQFLPYLDYRKDSPLGPRSAVEAAKMEIKAAMRSGLTGFQFYYPYGDDKLIEHYTDTVAAHFKAAEELDVAFSFTLCFANANHDEPEAEKIRRWAQHTKALIESTPAKYWLKTPDGRHIFFTWMVEGLADEVPNAWDVQYDAALVKFAALALENLSKAIGVESAWVQFFLKLEAGMDPDFTTELLDFFPAVWPWSQFDYRHYEANLYDQFARKARQRGRGFFYAATLDFYTSKTYPKQTWDLIFDIDKAKQLGVHGQYRHYMELELTRAFRNTLQRGIQQENGIINVVTWNDYAEGHHLAPDTNHNFAFAMILNYFNQRWRNPHFQVEKEQAAVFFKKYAHDVKPRFDFEIHTETAIDPAAADFIEVVTLLRAPASVTINGKPAGSVAAGIDSVRIPSEVGTVSFEVIRDGTVVLSLTATEAITDAPHRTDRHTYGYSTVEEDFIEPIFGNDRRSILPSREYNPLPE